VGQELTHTILVIRQKAVMCVHSFITKDPSVVTEFFPELVRLLSDSDLSVVNAVVNTFATLLKNQLNIRQICDLSNVCTLIQNAQVKMEYQHTPAPFMLINPFNLLRRMSLHMPELGSEVRGIRTQVLHTDEATSALLYEAFRTCIVLGLIELPEVRAAVSIFMNWPNQNDKFIGLGLLQALPELAEEFQATIIDCLEHPDSTIRLGTLELLHAMANKSNAQIIVVNTLKFFQRTKNERIRTELADGIAVFAVIHMVHEDNVAALHSWR
jgi:AP-4 complex subunit epsilon-1